MEYASDGGTCSLKPKKKRDESKTFHSSKWVWVNHDRLGEGSKTVDLLNKSD